jgi:hypothetical protein
MAYPSNTTGSVPSLSGTFIPEIWSTKLLDKFYDACIYSEIANTDYEGEIQKHGDTVKIRTTADIVINDYVKGRPLVYQNPESPLVDLLIDQGHYFAFNAFDLDKTQSDINLMNSWSGDGAEKIKIRVDTNILGSIYADAAAANAGATAGRKSYNINLGTTAAPVAVNKGNIIDHLVQFSTVMDEQNLPEASRFVVLSPAACARIKTSELKDASLSGDGQSTLRNGKVGMIDRMTVYCSNNLTVNTGGKLNVIFGHKSALTFASQITNMETLKNPEDFGDLVRSMMVYGFKVVKPESMGHSVITIA